MSHKNRVVATYILSNMSHISPKTLQG